MELLYKKINDYQVGERVDSFLIIKRVDLKTTNSNGKKYLDFILGDATGEITAKLWEVPPELEGFFEANMVVRVRGMINLYQNQLQFKIERIRLRNDEDPVDPADLVPSAPLEPEYMYGQILTKYIEGLENIDMKLIVERLFRENEEKLMYYPAAKRNHHAIRSGLLYHVLTMLQLADVITQVYPFLNHDLLVSGIILHDMAKLVEMDASDIGIVREYTIPGTLLGHISIGLEQIGRVGREVGASEEVVMLLQHMVLSHHYEPEYGSPVRPMFPEAEMLHHIDMIDARMYDMKKIQEELEPGTLSDFILSLDRRRVYRPEFDQEETI
ncbi:OB-fold nucleic acid binding domain-containing protein [Proteiniclasticum sp. QWL-01]|uniref:3'-5' exoribonuclease YhaM family protein n=1 Tax=Proteiniclasticum sp. QWL-01 TaxID=3036945 RepID=UPI0022062F35|nr:OB-fold nucleic acid binding domain-containing protein [Proteiniclasticum sp. QWL-01]UUM11564.1 OB-fold nucleic acid binding domain-containing protein [Clostridiaceae bacterium HFYG-1003]WFF73045.1 OB-fold nucleic acid binding domain-containing protein [Proteiniclasticum sp. QWL-01]